MPYHTSFPHHATAVSVAAAACGARCGIRLPDWTLVVHGAQGREEWRPKFLSIVDKRVCYTAQPVTHTIGFAGWFPYEELQWPVASDKLEFKKFARDNGIATPAACTDPKAIRGPFLVKPRGSSFSQGFRGPYLTYDASDPSHQLADGEYYENFVVGLIAKVWFYAGTCVAVHLDAPSIVTGDGTSTLAKLVRDTPNRKGKEHDWEVIRNLARYCGIDALDDVVPKGKEVLIEYRNASRYLRESLENRNRLASLAGTEAERRLKVAGAALAAAISPHHQERKRVYTLDAILESDGRLTALEANCSPGMHPDGYAAVLRGKDGN